jgi:imidazoleglycerol-phosphate dehydratase/histidinol-phosphatase
LKRILFIDRDGTLINEAPPNYQIDSFEKLEFYPHAFEFMTKIAKEFDYELVMVTNQDGLGTSSFPENTFWTVQNFVMKALENEGIHFSAVHIDGTLAKDNAPTRKPRTGMLLKYLNNEQYDIKNSFVIGDRITDVQLAKNLGCKAIWLNNDPNLGGKEISSSQKELEEIITLETIEWSKIYEFLKLGLRHVVHERNTNETKIKIDLNVDGSGKA